MQGTLWHLRSSLLHQDGYLSISVQDWGSYGTSYWVYQCCMLYSPSFCFLQSLELTPCETSLYCKPMIIHRRKLPRLQASFLHSLQFSVSYNWSDAFVICWGNQTLKVSRWHHRLLQALSLLGKILFAERGPVSTRYSAVTHTSNSKLKKPMYLS